MILVYFRIRPNYLSSFFPTSLPPSLCPPSLPPFLFFYFSVNKGNEKIGLHWIGFDII